MSTTTFASFLRRALSSVVVPALGPALAGALALGAGPAFAGEPSTSIHAFERAVAAAKQQTSGGGSVVTRAELRNALSFFQHDDGAFDAGERGHLGACLADPLWRAAISGPAIAYATELFELHAEGPTAVLAMTDVQAPLVDVLGAPGALTSSLWLQEGKLTSPSAAISHVALRNAYARSFHAAAGTFEPINTRELVNELSGRLELGMPTQDEVDGVLAYLTQGPRPATRLYLASWVSPSRDGNPGDIGGVVVAGVSADRKYVRFVELHVWTE